MTGWVFKRADEAEFREPGNLFPGASGVTTWRAVGEAEGPIHTDFGLTRIEADGATATMVHSFEYQFHVTEGEVVLATPEATVHLVAGDYGVVPIGVPHRWAGSGTARAVIADLMTPPPRAKVGFDTYRVPDIEVRAAIPVDARDPRVRSFGNIQPGHMDKQMQAQELLAVSASMRTALLVYSGITLKMMVDSDLGATLGSMFMVRYAPDGKAGPHDHPLEEAYLVTEGEVDIVLDGNEFRMRPGDIAWAGVGVVHSFAAVGEEVQWLETQAPQMPPRHAYRFARDWQYLEERLEHTE